MFQAMSTVPADANSICLPGLFALQHLGPFISTLHGDAVGDELISLFSYTAMGSSPGEGAAAGESSSDPDLRLFSAFR
jgi:hypothetical protein